MARGGQGVPTPLRGMHGLPAHQREAPAPHVQLVRKVRRRGAGGRQCSPPAEKVRWTRALRRLQVRARVSRGIRPAALVDEKSLMTVAVVFFTVLLLYRPRPACALSRL